MTIRAVSAKAEESPWLTRWYRALKTSLAVALLGIGPLVMVPAILRQDAHRNVVAEDFRLQVLPAVHHVLHGVSPYPQVHELLVSSAAYVYPPPTVVLSLPFGAVPTGVAAWLITAVMLALVPLTLFVLRIRDWRCYGAALFWAPIESAVQTANLSLPIALLAALAWRHRERLAGAWVAMATALKLVTWPLGVWLLATRRYAQAAAAGVLTVVVMEATWAAITFDGMQDYPALTKRLNELQAPHSYTVYAMGLELGLPSLFAKLLWIAVGVAMLSSCFIYGRRGDDRRSFALAVVACLTLSPIVWLHYLAVLLVPLAVTRPRFDLVWLLPIVLWLVPVGGGKDWTGRAAWQTALLLAALAAVTTFCVGWPQGRGGPKHARRAPAFSEPGEHPAQ